MNILPEAPTGLVAAGGNKTHTAGTAATASSALDLGAADVPRVINLTCTQAFNVAFSHDGTSTIANPADNSAFAANTLYRFRLSKQNRYLKFTPVADCVLTHWIDRA